MRRVGESEGQQVSVDEFIALGPLLPPKRSSRAAQQPVVFLVLTVAKENYLMNSKAARGLHLLAKD